jgi:uncharacterized membrane protein YdjX (TVP38/TMEM64 family)
MARSRRNLFACLIAVIVLACAGWFVSSQLTLAELAHNEQTVREAIAEHPFRSWLIGWVIYFFAALVPGTRGKAIACGWLFGFWPALLLVNLALTAAAQISFLASRFVVGDLVQSKYGAAVQHCNRLLEREGAWYVLLLRVVPISFSLTNYLLGVTRLSGWTFWPATQVGILPGNIVFVYLGASLPSLTSIVEHGIWSVFSWNVLFVLIVLSLFPLLVQRLVRRRLGSVPQAASVPKGWNVRVPLW